MPDTAFGEADVAGREVVGLGQNDFKLDVGRFAAIDYFGDGSFYIPNAPGVSNLNSSDLSTIC